MRSSQTSTSDGTIPLNFTLNPKSQLLIFHNPLIKWSMLVLFTYTYYPITSSLFLPSLSPLCLTLSLSLCLSPAIYMPLLCLYRSLFLSHCMSLCCTNTGSYVWVFIFFLSNEYWCTSEVSVKAPILLSSNDLISYIFYPLTSRQH